jgi:threonine aldolase
MGVGLHTVKNQPDGTMKLADIQDAVRADDPHYPRTRLVALENTHNTCGGRVLPMDFIHQVEEFCQDAKLKLHIDGARLANASVASGIPMADLVAGADSVSLCLSKGLGAPVGSILAGTEEFIYNAKRLRKSLGGGMRQAGVIAVAGKFALEHQLERLADDHANAKALAHGLVMSLMRLRDYVS